MGHTSAHRRSWEQKAACLSSGYPPDDIWEGRAKAVCAMCPVRQECQDYAVVHEEFGYFGGTTRNERRVLREDHLEYLGYRAVAEGWIESHHLLPPGLYEEYVVLAEEVRRTGPREDRQPVEFPTLLDIDVSIEVLVLESM